MALLAAATQVVVGWLAACLLAPRDRGLARLAWGLLLALTAVPWAATVQAFVTATPVTPERLAAWGLAGSGALGLLVWRRRAPLGVGAFERGGRIMGLLSLPLLLLGRLWYSGEQYALQRGAWSQTGDAECFYAQTFSLAAATQSAPTIPLRETYGIISTPGNLVFTTAAQALGGASGFAWTFAALWVLAAWFGYLLARQLRAPAPLAALLDLALVASPQWLRVEVLDRNSIAAVLALALLVALLRRAPPLLLGVLLGLLVGSGLRFLPAAYVLSVVLLAPRRAPRVLLVAAGVAAFNLPHLAQHGLHALGETASLWELAVAAVGDPRRTPFVPHVTGALYALAWLEGLGVLLAALAVLGAARLTRRAPTVALAMMVPALLALAVLAVQPEWIETDKLRIGLFFLPATLAALAEGSGWIVSLESGGRGGGSRSPRRLAGLAPAAALVLAAQLILVVWAPPIAPPGQLRRPTTRAEAPQWAGFLVRSRRPPAPWPRWDLGLKADLARKRGSQRLADEAAESAADARSAPRTASTTASEVPSQLLSSSSRLVPAPPRPLRDVCLHLDRLVDPHPARPGICGPLPFVDATDPATWQPIHHRRVSLPWEVGPVDVVARPASGALQAYGELTIELHAFELVQTPDGPILAPARQTRGLVAPPATSRSPSLHLRLFEGQHVVVRRWAVDAATGAPLRVDGWLVKPDGTVRAMLGEPESYL